MENVKSILMIIAGIVGCLLVFLIAPLIQGLISIILIIGIPAFILYIIVRFFQDEPLEEENREDKVIRKEIQPIANTSLIQEEIITLEKFVGRDCKILSQLVVDIDMGIQVLKVGNVTVANIDDKLKGNTVQKTIENLATINLNFIIYADKTELPCAIESKSQEEEVALL